MYTIFVPPTEYKHRFRYTWNILEKIKLVTFLFQSIKCKKWHFLFFYTWLRMIVKDCFSFFCLSCLTKRIIHAVTEVSVKVDYIYFYFYYYAQWFILWIKMRKEWSFILLRVIKENLKLIYISYLLTQLLHAKYSSWKKV